MTKRVYNDDDFLRSLCRTVHTSVCCVCYQVTIILCVFVRSFCNCALLLSHGILCFTLVCVLPKYMHRYRLLRSACGLLLSQGILCFTLVCVHRNICIGIGCFVKLAGKLGIPYFKFSLGTIGGARHFFASTKSHDTWAFVNHGSFLSSSKVRKRFWGRAIKSLSIHPMASAQMCGG